MKKQSMLIRPFTQQEQIQHQNLQMKIKALQQAGICPTCQNLKRSDVYPPNDDRVFYENDLLSCFLESFPRNPGHSIILVKTHFEDISELPLDLGENLSDPSADGRINFKYQISMPITSCKKLQD